MLTSRVLQDSDRDRREGTVMQGIEGRCVPRLSLSQKVGLLGKVIGGESLGD